MSFGDNCITGQISQYQTYVFVFVKSVHLNLKCSRSGNMSHVSLHPHMSSAKMQEAELKLKHLSCMNERRNGRAPAHLGSSHPHFLIPSHLTSWQGCRKKLDTQDGSVRHPPPGCESSRMLGPCITHPEQNKRAPALGSSSTASSGASFPLPPLQR